MAHDVIIPKTGIYMDDVHLLEWLAEEGAQVSEGQPILRIETNKVEQEVEAEASGWLHRQAAAGAEYPIGTQIGLIAASPEEYEQIAAGG